MGATRIAIVCAHFAPGSGYQEGALASAFSQLGYDVRVVTSTRTSRNARALGAVNGAPGSPHAGERYDVVRLAPLVAIGSNVIGRGVRASVAEFAPDLVVLVGPAKLFGLSLFAGGRRPWKRLAIVQDNSEAASTGGGFARMARSLVDRLVKRPAYRRVLANADRIVLNVPETRAILETWVRGRSRRALDAKAVDLRLGFDPEQFFFDEAAGRAWRSSHGVGDGEVLLATVTRATARKRLDDVFAMVLELRSAGLPVRYVLAGVGDDACGRTLRRAAAAHPDAFLLLPVVGQDEMRELFSAADVGFWPQTAISIQQAMGTGLPIVLKQKPTVSHLLQPGANGWYADPRDLSSALGAAVREVAALPAGARVGRRRLIEAMNRQHLAYDVVAAEMIDAL